MEQSWEADKPSYFRNSPACKEAESPLACSKEPATRPYPKPVKSFHILRSDFLKIHFSRSTHHAQVSSFFHEVFRINPRQRVL